MTRVVLIMHRKSIAQGLMVKLQNSQDICLTYRPEYDKANESISQNKANVALIEVAESGPYDMDYCLALCEKLRTKTPNCKLLLMFPEQDVKGIKKVVEAKSEKLIDDFVFYDVTIDYLASKLMSI